MQCLSRDQVNILITGEDLVAELKSKELNSRKFIKITPDRYYKDGMWKKDGQSLKEEFRRRYLFHSKSVWGSKGEYWIK